jgi:L-ascorbate peroxidase
VLIVFAIFQRRGEVRVSSGRFGTVAFKSDPDQLKSAREDIKELLGTKFGHPLMVIFSAFFFDFV